MFTPAPIDKNFVPYSKRPVLMNNAGLFVDGAAGKGRGRSRVGRKQVFLSMTLVIASLRVGHAGPVRFAMSIPGTRNSARRRECVGPKKAAFWVPHCAPINEEWEAFGGRCNDAEKKIAILLSAVEPSSALHPGSGGRSASPRRYRSRAGRY